MKKGKIKYLIMRHLGIRVTTYCNLNCKDCADLIPFQKNCHYDYELLIQDLKKILSVVDFLEEVLLGGGEIFLYPRMYHIVDFCVKQNKIGKVIIVTNGTIMPSENLVELFKNPKVIVRVSGYGEDVVPRRKELIGMLERVGIKIDNLEKMTWRDVGGAECRNRTPNEIENVWDRCIMNECEGMTSRGRLYWCARAIASDELDIYPNPHEDEYVDVRNTSIEELGDKLEKFYNLKYISTCNYCDGINANSPFVPTAAQIVKKDIALQLLSYLDELKNSTVEGAPDIIISWIQFVKENFEHFIYEERFKDVLDVTLSCYENKAIDGILDESEKDSIGIAWNSFINDIFSKYCFDIKCETEKVKENQIKKYNCFVKRNTISVLLLDNEITSEEESKDANIIMSVNDLKRERDWEKRLGVKSVIRNFFLDE